MADVLLSQLQFADVAAGGSAALPHGLNIEGIAEIPDFLWQDNPNFSLTADNVDVTVTNNSDAIASVVVMCEMPHSISRVFGVEGQESLAIRPFVPTVGVGEHSLAGASHLADTLANLQDRVSDATLAALGVTQVFTKAQTVEQIDLATAVNVAVDGAGSNNFRVLPLDQNVIVDNPTGVKNGQTINIAFKQDATGGRTVGFDTAYLFPGGAPTITPDANAWDMISCYVVESAAGVATTMLCSAAQGVAGLYTGRIATDSSFCGAHAVGIRGAE